ncbi:cytochrome b5 isoform X2 [Spodoptera frugiperda]|uniref:Cytochrome b5 n=1 Tax=Spodoptera frugiperda TaxID=7108 RepID=A0A9R0EIT8_SPOFR|nr:cytochrome b5 isoform X2 [Spodoptera frugiperda]
MSKILTAEEVKRHNTRKSVWMVIRNEVYDVTSFVDEHPGGEDPILDAAGQDATIAFEDVGHSEDAKAMLKKYKIGTLAPGEGCSQYHRDCTECNASSDKPGTSDSKSWRSFDGGTPTSLSRKSSLKCYKEPLRPMPEKRIQHIVVPRERRRRGPPCAPSNSRLKYVVLALGIAILLGFAYKKYSSG